MHLKSILHLPIVLLSFISHSSSFVTRECKGCPSTSILRSPAYGIDLSTDYLAIAVQHVNGTLEPIAHLNASTTYRAAMLSILSSASIDPYGHRSMDEKPSPITDSAVLDPSHIATFTKELRSLLASIHPPQPFAIEHYFLSVPMYFTHHDESLVLAAIKNLKMPKPISTVTADSSAFLGLKRGNCEHFVSCVPVDFEKHILLFVEYSRSTMSASFMNFWGGWFLTPHAYFVDVSLGAEKEEGRGEVHWAAITKRVKDLIEDYEHKLFEGPSDGRRFMIDSLRLSFIGEGGANPKFRKAIEDALKPFAGGKEGLGRYEEEKVLDPTYLTALSVAREGKDRIDKRGIMCGCNSEKVACTKIREMVIRESLVEKGYKGYQRWRDEL